MIITILDIALPSFIASIIVVYIITKFFPKDSIKMFLLSFQFMLLELVYLFWIMLPRVVNIYSYLEGFSL